MEKLFARIRESLESVGCEITSFKDLGQQTFIRVTDRHHPADIYLEYEFGATPEAPDAIQEKFRLDRTVNRILVQSI